ncbi:MAG TPA: hypothetical protein DCY79_05330, partial [Planctomycetaceae bacterium]|nr:hypothetical protein [Planctomycetaceae bacterium]
MLTRQRIFVYEFITGGGLLQEPTAPQGSLRAEGAAMLAAVTHDLGQLPHVEVVTRLDHRLARDLLLDCQIELATSPTTEHEEFCATAASADWTLVIAPEFDSILHDRASAVLAAGGKLLGAQPEYIQRASDKIDTAQALLAAGIPTPLTLPLNGDLAPLANNHHGYVVKPRDGAGSLQVSIHRTLATARECNPPQRYCIQPWVPGVPCSVLLLCSPTALVSLKATEQHLASDGTLAYLGGTLPLAVERDHRARQLAENGARALGQPGGFIGVDLLLSADGKQDMVIEVNPRLTTSYAGRRCLTEDNLAQQLLTVMNGEAATVAWLDHQLRFDACGHTTQACRHA